MYMYLYVPLFFRLVSHGNHSNTWASLICLTINSRVLNLLGNLFQPLSNLEFSMTWFALKLVVDTVSEDLPSYTVILVTVTMVACVLSEWVVTTSHLSPSTSCWYDITKGCHIFSPEHHIFHVLVHRTLNEIWIQWNLYINTTLGTNKMWFLYPGCLYMQV